MTKTYLDCSTPPWRLQSGQDQHSQRRRPMSSLLRNGRCDLRAEQSSCRPRQAGNENWGGGDESPWKMVFFVVVKLRGKSWDYRYDRWPCALFVIWMCCDPKHHFGPLLRGGGQEKTLQASCEDQVWSAHKKKEITTTLITTTATTTTRRTRTIIIMIIIIRRRTATTTKNTTNSDDNNNKTSPWFSMVQCFFVCSSILSLYLIVLVWCCDFTLVIMFVSLFLGQKPSNLCLCCFLRISYKYIKICWIQMVHQS